MSRVDTVGENRLVKKLVFAGASLSSIGILLLHLSGVLMMWKGAVVLGGTALLVMVGIWWVAWKKKDEELLRILRLGFFGGIAGILGYDLIRVPFHLAGMNPFAPIYSYGMWICGASSSTIWTDLAGFLYHLSNGITFGWIYALFALRRHWVFGLLWGLLIELFAILSVFGLVFGMRDFGSLVVWLAFAAHLFYGIPLGMICMKPEAEYSKVGVSLASILAVGGVAWWFVNATHEPSLRPSHGVAEIAFDREVVGPGWSDMELGSVMTLVNRGKEDVVLLYREPDGLAAEPESLVVAGGESRELVFEKVGLYQIGSKDVGWRSVFVTVREEGDYRPGDG